MYQNYQLFIFRSVARYKSKVLAVEDEKILSVTQSSEIDAKLKVSHFRIE